MFVLLAFSNCTVGSEKRFDDLDGNGNDNYSDEYDEGISLHSIIILPTVAKYNVFSYRSS